MIVFGVCLLLTPMGKRLRDWSYELPFLLRSSKTINDVVIVALKEETYRELVRGRGISTLQPCATSEMVGGARRENGGIRHSVS